ncbi:MAG TPA: GWxTD domain-containing protein [Acidobacteriota bacterium]|nr:GWxTD domain-containing protein [Acidobacteriota bacterium]
MASTLGPFFFALTLAWAAMLPVAAQDQRQEESTDYYKKWLSEDVVYIISEEEREVFANLTTDEERDQFIEQFWYRRDPDPRSSVNEYKQEHYRRIAYANERFHAGFAGWRTDRGKVYIMHGPPDERQEYPSGGTYDRPLSEGGGTTATYPFEIWRYRHIPGVGTNVELEFVDRANSGEYRLALGPEEKDAFLHVPTAGHTAAELLGLATRLQRPYFSPHASYPLMNYREQDSSFQRYERFVGAQRTPEIKYTDLQQLVRVDTSYDALPFQSRVDYFRLNDHSILVPVTVQVNHADLAFSAQQEEGASRAKIALYGLVTGIDNRIAAEFEDEIVASFQSAEQAARQIGNGSLYQKLLILDARKRYKVNLVLKDLNSGKIGVRAMGLRPPRFEEDALSASSLVLSDFIVPAQEGNQEEQMFLLGDVLVRPRLDATFSPQDYFAVYTQLHNVGVDQSSLRPDFEIRYRITKDGKTQLQQTDETGNSVQYFSPNRMVLIKRLPLNGLKPGAYQIEVEYVDRIRQTTIARTATFRVSDS